MTWVPGSSPGMTLLRHGLRSAGTFATGFVVQANGEPSPPTALVRPPRWGGITTAPPWKPGGCE